MDFSSAYKHTALVASAGPASASPLQFSPDGALVAHAVGPRLVVRDSESQAIVRVWDLETETRQPWKSVDALEWSPDGALLLAACLKTGDIRVVCPDQDLDAVLADGMGAGSEGWYCRIAHGETIAGVRWGPGGTQIWIWEDLNLRVVVHSLTNLSSAVLVNTKHGADRGVSIHPSVATRVLVLERRDCKDTIAIYTTEETDSQPNMERESKVSGYGSQTARGSLSVAGTQPPNQPDPFPLALIHRFEVTGPSSTTATGNTPANPILDAADAQWSPDGRSILVLDTPLNYVCHAYAPDGRCIWNYSPLRHITDLPLGIRTHSWGFSGRYLALGGFDGRARIVDSWGWKGVVGWCGEIGAVMEGGIDIWKESESDRGKLKFERVTTRPFNVPVQRPEISLATSNASLDGKGPTGMPKTGISAIEWSPDGEWIVTKNESTPTTLLIHHVPTLTLHTVIVCRSAPVRPTFNPKSAQGRPATFAWASSNDTALYTWDPRYGPEAWEVPAGPEGFKVRGVRWNAGSGRSIGVWEAPPAGEKGGRWCIGYPVEEGQEEQQSEFDEIEERAISESERTSEATPYRGYTRPDLEKTPFSAGFRTPIADVTEPEGLESSMDRLTVSAFKSSDTPLARSAGPAKRGTPAHGLLGRYDFDDESSRAETESRADSDSVLDSEPSGTPGLSPALRGRQALATRQKTPAMPRFAYEEREIKVDDDDGLPGGGYHGGLFGKLAGSRSDATLWAASREFQ